MAQLNDKGLKIIKEMLAQKVENYKCSHQDSKGTLWFEDQHVVPKDLNLRKKILDEALSPNFLYTLGAIKCTIT
jgi:hypothetical protein